MHESAFVFYFSVYLPASALARLWAADTLALKVPHQARRRGGESTARWGYVINLRPHLVVERWKRVNSSIGSQLRRD